MKCAEVIVGRTPSGGYKAYLVGQHDVHMMDWRGMNCCRATVKGQPNRGFKTIEEAKAFATSKFSTQREVFVFGERAGNGTFLGDKDFVAMGFDLKQHQIDLPRS